MSVQDDICNRLRSLGVNAQIAEPDLVKHVERVIGVSIIGSPMSVTVDIPDGPIRWFNVMSQIKWINASADPSEHTRMFTRYGVPDPRLSLRLPAIKIKAKLKKALDIQWKGKDSGLGIIDRLNSDISLKGPIMNARGDVEIRAYRPYGCWVIRTGGDPTSGELWNCYQAIASHLLTEFSR